jgi:hypothetical protein
MKLMVLRIILCIKYFKENLSEQRNCFRKDAPVMIYLVYFSFFVCECESHCFTLEPIARFSQLRYEHHATEGHLNVVLFIIS